MSQQWEEYEAMIRECIKHQESEDQRIDQLALF